VPLAAPVVPIVVEELPAETAEAWKQCTSELNSLLKFDAQQADTVITKAFGWGSQGYWRQEKVAATPTVAQIEAALALLVSIGIESPQDQAAIVKKFPEVLGLDVELMQENVVKLQNAYFLKGKALAAAVKRKPRVLGSTVDCEGSCQGFCTRCFAQF
jgi:hypothetical protein